MNKINLFSRYQSTSYHHHFPYQLHLHIFRRFGSKFGAYRVKRSRQPLFRETRSGQEEEHWQGKTYRLWRIRSCSYLMARSREPQADGYNGIVCAQKTERYYSEREGFPARFLSSISFCHARSYPSLSAKLPSFVERRCSYLHKRYLPTASTDRKKNTIHEITHAHSTGLRSLVGEYR